MGNLSVINGNNSLLDESLLLCAFSKTELCPADVSKGFKVYTRYFSGTVYLCRLNFLDGISFSCATAFWTADELEITNSYLKTTESFWGF